MEEFNSRCAVCSQADGRHLSWCSVVRDRRVVPYYESIGIKIGKLVQEKNKAYGDSFNQAGKVLEVLYPNGIGVGEYRDMLAIVRVVDKLFRIANRKDYQGEDPWMDIAGYGILGVRGDE